MPTEKQNHNINITSQSIDQLNMLIAGNITNEKSHRFRIFSTSSTIPPTAWEISIKSPPKDIKISINNGKTIFFKTIEYEPGDQFFFATSFNGKAILPLKQFLTIESTSGIPFQLNQIKASTRFTTWQLLNLIRPDIFLNKETNTSHWLIQSGFHELNLISQDANIIHYLNTRIEGTSITELQQTIWNIRPDVQDTFKSITNPSFLEWLQTHGRNEYQLPTLTNAGKMTISFPKQTKYLDRPFGVNLIGYASTTLGIGEDVRTCKEALDKMKIPTSMIDISTYHTSKEQRQTAREEHERIAPYAFNLICMTAEENARIILELGLTLFSERYNIGYWPWELSKWPEEWRPLFGLVDEIWASSRHTYHSISAAISLEQKPILNYLPLGVSALKSLSDEQKKSIRNTFKLPTSDFLAICSFDGRSSFLRKNPWGAIKSFQRAFPQQQKNKVSLVIKTLNASVDTDEWEKLRKTAQLDPRIHLIDASLSRDEIINLYGCCDVFLSLHRAEGFGRIIAESLLLGLDVIATNYSGNVDFCQGMNFHPVNYDLRPLPKGSYPYSNGQNWAEPSVDHAAELLLKIHQQQPEHIGTKNNLKVYQEKLSIDSVGRNYKARLLELWTQSQQLNNYDVQLSRNNCLYGLNG